MIKHPYSLIRRSVLKGDIGAGVVAFTGGFELNHSGAK